MRRFTRKKRARSRHGMVDITLTPLIDTALTLLVIFMIAAPMMRNAINIQLPKGEVQEVREDTPRMMVQIDAKGQLFFDGKPIATRDLLLERIKKEAMHTKIKTVIVEGDEHTVYGSVFGLIDQIKAKVKEIDNVAMSARRT